MFPLPFEVHRLLLEARRVRAMVAAVLAMSAGASGYPESVLQTGCAPVAFAVTYEFKEGFGLTEDRMAALLEARLRGARLYDPDALLQLNVGVQVLSVSNNAGRRGGWAYRVDLELMRLAVFRHPPAVAARVPWPVVSWGFGTLGITPADDGGGLYQYVGESVDRFILEYLRANADACGGPP